MKYTIITLLLFVSFGFSQNSTTTITDTQGNVTTKSYVGAFLKKVVVNQGTSTILSTVNYCYNGEALPCTGTVTTPITQRDVYTVTPGAGTSQSTTLFNSYGLPTSAKLYDFGSVLVSQSTTTYCSLGNTSVRNRTCTVTNKDSNGTTVNQTVSTYDTNGNVLSQASLVSGSTFLTKSATYSSKGIPLTATDINGAVTNYTNGACNNVFPTNIVYPLIGTESYIWNCNGAVITTATKVTGAVSSLTYNDPFWRVTSETNPYGDTISSVYTPLTTLTGMSFSNSTTDDLLTVDLWGRPKTIQSKQNLNSTQFNTASYTYDSNGRLATKSIPCLTSAGQVCSDIDTSVLYDALNREISTTSQGSTVTTVYSKGDVTHTVSGSNNQKQLEYDGLGRLVSVCEITSAPGAVSCGQRVGGTGYLTTYTLDSLGRTTSIVQGAQTRSFTYDDMGRVLTEINPESGTVTYTYDTTASCGGITSSGDLVKKVDNAGNTICYTYDTLHRLTSKVYSGPNATDNAFFVYDVATVNSVVMANGKGQLVEAYTCTSCPGTKITDIGFSYDTARLTDVYESTPNSGGYYHMSSTYYPNGSIKTISGLPGLSTITYGLNGEGRISTVSTDQPLVNETLFNPAGLITSITFGSTDNDKFFYDSTNKMFQYFLNVGTSSLIGVLSYNNNGTLNTLALTDPFNAANTQNCNYAYDSVLRLSGANCGTTSQTFSYDLYGNVSKTGSFSFSPTYTVATNHISSAGFTYDANGNMTSDGVNSYTYDAEGRMVSGPGVTVVYNAAGKMAEQTRGIAHQQIVYSPMGDKLALMNGQSLVMARVALTGGSEAVYTSSGLQYYTHTDNIGSARLSSTPSRINLYSLSFAPFGEAYNNSGVPTSNLSFTGFKQDTVTGLYDSDSREYSPSQGRWITPDLKSNPSVTDSQSFNRYAYVENRPLQTTDRSGAGDEPGTNPDFPGDPNHGSSTSSTVVTECYLLCEESGSGTTTMYGPNGGDVAIDPLGQAILSNSMFGLVEGTITPLAEAELGIGAAVVTGGAVASSGLLTVANTFWLTTGLPTAVAMGCAELCNGISMGSLAADESGLASLPEIRKHPWQKVPKFDPNVENMSDIALFMNTKTKGARGPQFTHLVEMMRDSLVGSDFKYHDTGITLKGGTITKDAARAVLKRWYAGQDIWYAVHDVNDPSIRAAIFEMRQKTTLYLLEDYNTPTGLAGGPSQAQALIDAAQTQAKEVWEMPAVWGLNAYLKNTFEQHQGGR